MRLFGLELKRAKPPEPSRARARGITARQFARMLFNSGESNRLTGDWPTMPVPIDWIIHRYQRTLVARSREQSMNNDYVKAYFRLQRQNIVGPAGIMFQSKAQDDQARIAIENAFRDWGKRENCDVTGRRSWRAIQNAFVTTAARDGECFIREVFGRDAGPYGYALQLLDSQRCPVDYDRELENGAFIRHGIEFNAYGKPLAYHFADTSGARSAMHYSYAGRSYVRIDADEIIHGFVPEFVGQKRGLPWLDTGLFRAHQMAAMEDAAVVNARVGAAKMGFIQWKEGHGPEYDEDEDGPLEIDAEAASFPVLPEGAELNKFDPTYPSGELLPFVKLMLRAFAAGGGVAYENLSHDREGVNFTSIRHGTLDERENYKERQEWLVEDLCERVFSRFLERALLGRKIVTESGLVLPASAIELYEPRAWQPRRWEWVDPEADTKAAERSKNNLLTSFSSLIRERGREPRDVWRELAEDIKAMREAGIPDEIITLAMGQKVAGKTDTRNRESE